MLRAFLGMRPSRLGLFVLSAVRFGRQGLCSAPPKIVVPKAKLQIAHARSSGPGGQNVNKVNTKVELRFHVRNADWLPSDVKARLIEDNANRMNKDGELIVTAQESRSQASNMELALGKVQEMVDLACIPPKVQAAAWHRASSGARAAAGCCILTLCRFISLRPRSALLASSRPALPAVRAATPCLRDLPAAARDEDRAVSRDEAAESRGQAAHLSGEAKSSARRLLTC